VDRGLAAGEANGNAQKLYAKWHKVLKDHFDVPSYLEIRADQEQQAIDWLQTMKVLRRSKIRRTNNTMWRNDLYTGIYARQGETGKSKADVYQLVETLFGKK
jgi:ORF6C domain